MSFAVGTRVRDTSGSNWIGTIEQGFVKRCGPADGKLAICSAQFPQQL